MVPVIVPAKQFCSVDKVALTRRDEEMSRQDSTRVQQSPTESIAVTLPETDRSSSSPKDKEKATDLSAEQLPTEDNTSTLPAGWNTKWSSTRKRWYYVSPSRITQWHHPTATSEEGGFNAALQSPSKKLKTQSNSCKAGGASEKPLSSLYPTDISDARRLSEEDVDDNHFIQMRQQLQTCQAARTMTCNLSKRNVQTFCEKSVCVWIRPCLFQSVKTCKACLWMSNSV